MPAATGGKQAPFESLGRSAVRVKSVTMKNCRYFKLLHRGKKKKKKNEEEKLYNDPLGLGSSKRKFYYFASVPNPRSLRRRFLD